MAYLVKVLAVELGDLSLVLGTLLNPEGKNTQSLSPDSHMGMTKHNNEVQRGGGL